MALDHYVSQVHLRGFYSPKLGQLAYAIRKSDLEHFPCNSESICRIEEGSTNAYLINDRAIEEFLRDVEPKYNPSVAKLRRNEIDQESVLSLAGFAAYVGSCTPAAMRIHSEPLQNAVRSTAAILDRQGKLPKAPPELEGKTLTELFEEGVAQSEIDPKYPQALGIIAVVGRTSIFGNSYWDVLLNTHDNNPFFTSDYPIALEQLPGQRVPNWLVPLAPDIAIRIVPDISLSRREPDLSFAKFNYRVVEPTAREVRDINRLIVQCAEDLVLYRDGHAWIRDFVAKYRWHRVEAITERIPYGTGFMNISRQKIVRREHDASA